MQISRTLTTPLPIQEVFDFLADFTTTTEWDPGTVRTARTSGDGSVGTRYENVSRFLGRETRLSYVVEELVPGSRIILRGENATVEARDTMAFEEVPEGGTRVTYTADFRFKGAARLVGPFLVPAFRKLGDEAERGLGAALARLAA